MIKKNMKLSVFFFATAFLLVSFSVFALNPNIESSGGNITITGTLELKNELAPIEIPPAPPASVDPEIAAVDPLTVKRFFERLWGKALPLHAGGYYMSIENKQGTKSCVGRNPITASCGCRSGTISRLVELRSVDVRYSERVSVGRFLYLYGC